MATLFVIDLERRICIARGSNVEVLAKFADRKSGSSYTGNLNDVIGALKVDELTDLNNNHCGDLDLPPREKKFAKKVDAKKALKNILTSANIAEPKNGGSKKTSKKKQSNTSPTHPFAALILLSAGKILVTANGPLSD